MLPQNAHRASTRWSAGSDCETGSRAHPLETVRRVVVELVLKKFQIESMVVYEWLSTSADALWPRPGLCREGPSCPLSRPGTTGLPE